MPIMRCTLPRGGQGWKWGKSGKCYASKADAERQMRAIKASQQSEGGGDVIHNIEVFIENFAVRFKHEAGKQYLVVPIIALVEGVHHGSRGKFYYPAAEIQSTASDWNGVPVTVDHPSSAEGEPILAREPYAMAHFATGTFRNVRYDEEGRLKGEGWIERNKLKSLSPKALALLLEGIRMEVSTGVVTDSDGVPGTWHGEQYEGTVGNFRPDHLALLPNATGACSYHDGCGVRNKEGCNSEACKVRLNKRIDELILNRKGGEENVDREKLISMVINGELDEAGYLEALKKLGFVINELTHSKLNNELRKLVNDMDKPGVVHFLRDVYNDRFIYEKMSEGENKLFELAYSVNSDDEVKIKKNAEPKEVKEQTKFIPVNLSEGDGSMNDKKKVDAIIANKHLAIYTEDNRKELEEMEEATFNTTVDLSERLLNCKDCNKEEEPKPEPTANEQKKEDPKEDPKKEEDPKVTSFDELLANASEEQRELWNSGMKANKQAKTALVSALMKNKKVSAVHSEEQLMKKSIEELQFLTSLSGEEEPVDYSGQGSVHQDPQLKRNERHPNAMGEGLDGGVPDMPEIDWNKAANTPVPQGD